MGNKIIETMREFHRDRESVEAESQRRRLSVVEEVLMEKGLVSRNGHYASLVVSTDCLVRGAGNLRLLSGVVWAMGLSDRHDVAGCVLLVRGYRRGAWTLFLVGEDW